MTQTLLLFCRISILKVSPDPSLQSPLEDPCPPVDAFSAQLNIVWHHGAARVTSGNIKVSLTLLHVPFLTILQSMNLPKTAEKREGKSICAQMCHSLNRQPGLGVQQLQKYNGRREENPQQVWFCFATPLPSNEVMLVVYDKARLQWANFIFHTCLFICWKGSLCRSVDSLETDIKTGL